MILGRLFSDLTILQERAGLDASAAELDEARAGSGGGQLGRQSALSDEDRTLIGNPLIKLIINDEILQVHLGSLSK